MVPAWKEAAERIAVDLLESYPEDVEFLSVAEAVGEWVEEHGLESERSQMISYVGYLIDNATVEVTVTLPKERL